MFAKNDPVVNALLLNLFFFTKIIHVSNQKLKLIAHVRASTYLLECGMFGWSKKRNHHSTAVPYNSEILSSLFWFSLFDLQMTVELVAMCLMDCA